MTTYVMTAEENFDATRKSLISGLTTYLDTVIATDQNYQGIQWDPVRRNLMYMYVENLPTTPTTNTTGHTIWNGETSIASGGAVDPSIQFNSYVCTKNIDSGAVTFYKNYDATKTVPAGISSSDGTWRRYTQDFQAVAPQTGGNGPGMTDPYTSNFWINSESCILYCFRQADNYAQVISPLQPITDPDHIVQVVGFTNTGPTGPWTYAREIDGSAGLDDVASASLYLTPREFTSEETTEDKLLIYATYTYPRTAPTREFHSCNREIFDHAGNMYVASCASTGGKGFQLHMFTPPDDAPYGGPTVGGGFTEITPWTSTTGPNADGTDYTLARTTVAGSSPNTSSVIPMYLPETDDIVMIEKFFPEEKTALSTDPAEMFWSCSYIHDPSGAPTFTHFPQFVTGYMTSDWFPTTIDNATYAVYDAFEVNNYLGQSDYEYEMDYTQRWFFFQCVKLVDGVPDDKARIVLVQYQFAYGVTPAVLQVIDEQGWDDTYPTYEADYDSNAFGTSESAAVATAMQTIFNIDSLNMLWDVGIYDPTTGAFWWSGGASDQTNSLAYFTLFDSAFDDRTTQNDGTAGEGLNIGATPPFMKLLFSGSSGGTAGHQILTAWAFPQDEHIFYVVQLGIGGTMIYDTLSGQWAEWISPDVSLWRGSDGRAWEGFNVCCDTQSGILWKIDADNRLDYETTPITSKVVAGSTVNFRTNTPAYMAELAISETGPAEGIDVDEVNISMRSGDTVTWYDHGEGQTDTTKISVRWYGLGLMSSPGRVFEITDTGLARRLDGFKVEVGDASTTK